MSNHYDYMTWVTINKTSPEVAKILEKEMNRQDNTVELIASENYVSDAIKAACVVYLPANMPRESRMQDTMAVVKMSMSLNLIAKRNGLKYLM